MNLTFNLSGVVPQGLVTCEDKLSVLMPRYCSQSSRYVLIVLCLMWLCSLSLMVAYKFDWISTEQYVGLSQRLFPSFLMLGAPAIYLLLLTQF